MVSFAYVHAVVQRACCCRPNVIVVFCLFCLLPYPALSQQAPVDSEVAPAKSESVIGSLDEEGAVAERVEAQRQDAGGEGKKRMDEDEDKGRRGRKE